MAETILFFGRNVWNVIFVVKWGCQKCMRKSEKNYRSLPMEPRVFYRRYFDFLTILDISVMHLIFFLQGLKTLTNGVRGWNSLFWNCMVVNISPNIGNFGWRLILRMSVKEMVNIFVIIRSIDVQNAVKIRWQVHLGSPLWHLVNRHGKSHTSLWGAHWALELWVGVLGVGVLGIVSFQLESTVICQFWDKFGLEKVDLWHS